MPEVVNTLRIQICFGDWNRAGWFPRLTGAGASGKHRPLRGANRSEAEKTYLFDHVVVDGFHPSAHQVRFVPEAGSS